MCGDVFNDLERRVDVGVVIYCEGQREIGLLVVFDVQVLQRAATNFCVVDRVEDLSQYKDISKRETMEMRRDRPGR